MARVAAYDDGTARFGREDDTVLDAVPAPIWVMRDASGQRIWSNRQAARLLRQEPGVNPSLSAPADERPRHFRFFRNGVEADPSSLALQRALLGERVRDEAYEVRFDDGTSNFILVSANPILGADGAVIGAVATATDTTDSKLAEEEHRQERETLIGVATEAALDRQRVFELSRDLFGCISLEGRLEAVNPSWTRVLGHREAALLGEDLWSFIHPDDIETARRRVAMLRNGLLPPRFELRLRRVDDAYRWISWTAVPIGQVFYAVGRDVTEEKQAAEELSAANRQLLAQIEERERVESTLRQMQRVDAIGQITSGVAHDFNNLLTVVLGSVRYLEREVHKGTHDAQFARWVEHLRIAAERGAKLTRQLLAFSRQQKLEPQSVNVNQIVSGMSDLLRTTLGAGVSVDARLNFDLPPALADQTQLELVVINLCINGRDAMNGEGKLAITTELRTVETQPRIEGPAPGRYVVISVSDTGSGMPPQVLERAFEPFFTTKDVGKGSGLGLSQVLGFAKQSGGGVVIDTKLGHGTTVSVYLPLARQPIVFPERTPAAAPTVALGAKRVLLVDDDATVREITAATVRELGCGVVEAASAGAALDIVTSDEHIDVAVIDFAMPGMNGAELARRFRTSKPSLPIVFISGHADLSALADLADCPVLRKPFGDGELAECLQRTLSPQ